MTKNEMIDIFDDNSEEFLEFNRIQEKLSSRSDIHAFILMNNLVSDTQPIISASEHDEFFLSVNPYLLAEVITKDQVIDLIRCGIRYHIEYDCFCMFA